MEYKATLDSLAKGVTTLITLLLALIIIGQLTLISGKGLAVPLVTIVLLLVIYFGVFAFRTTGYDISIDKLIIHRLFDAINIDIKEIKSVEVIDKRQLQWSIRIFSVGGLFGYFGRFSNMKLGRMTWYATRRDKPVLLVTIYDKKIILTPDDPERFVSDINSKPIIN